MKKIMFDDKYGLTDAVLKRLKPMTRRICKEYATKQPILSRDVESFRFYPDENIVEFLMLDGTTKVSIPPYKINEVVAVAQSYKDLKLSYIPHIDEPDFKTCTKHAPQWGNPRGMKGWSNKMFVRPDLMPHQIQITDFRVECLQDISDEDCLKDGVECYLDIISEKGASKYERHAEEECWIAGGDGENHYDQSISYCRNCAERIAKKENKEKGYGEWDNYYHRDGGWGQEHERSALSCEECGKPLLFDYIPTFFDDDIEELCLDDISDLYLLDQMLHNCDDEIREKAIQRLARPAFAALINRPGVGHKGLWEENPYVFAYTFKLIK